MNQADLQRKLIAAARGIPTDDRVPYAFEQRIMAQLAGQTAPDSGTLWARALSRSAVFCVGAMVVLSLVSYVLPTGQVSNTDSLSQDVEQTLMAAVDGNTVEQDN